MAGRAQGGIMWTPINRDWTVKPPLGTPLRTDGHWSVQGLVGCWLFNEEAGKAVINAVTGAGVVCPNPPIWVYGGVNTVSYPSSGVKVPVVFSASEFSIVAMFRQSLSGGSPDYAIGAYVDNSNGYSLGFNGDYSSTMRCVIQGDIAGAQPLAYTSSALLNKVWSVTASKKANAIRGYANGALESSAGWAATSTFAGITVLADALNTYNCGLQGQSGILIVYNRALSPNEIASLSANPYQVCQP